MLPDWDERFAGCEPEGHLLRDAFPRRWVRFHSLPDSKRYPETPTEHAEVLRRHNAILGELAPVGSRVVLVTTGYSETPVPVRTYEGLLALDPAAVFWRTLARHQPDEEATFPNWWHLFTSAHVWRPGTFDPVIRLVADGTVANVLVVAPDCRWVLHPYDGGMDVIAESAEERGRLRATYSDWLSRHPGGL
ncbi:MAG: hypothetical protein K2W96_04550 [Gemmataceae bacterium]|nr:hypothetical protein [Gemmataceae bacterium]